MPDSPERFCLGSQDVYFNGTHWVLWTPPDRATESYHPSFVEALRALGRPDLATLMEMDDQKERRR